MESWGFILFAVWVGGQATSIHLPNMPPAHFETKAECEVIGMEFVELVEKQFTRNDSIDSVKHLCFQLQEADSI